MLDQWIETVSRRAGWRTPALDARGCYRFRLDGGLWVDASSPDGRTLRLSAELGPLPLGGQGDYLLGRAGVAAVSRAGTDTGIVSLDRRRGVLCYDAFHSLGIMRAGEMHLSMQSFLNELDFWSELCNSN